MLRVASGLTRRSFRAFDRRPRLLKLLCGGHGAGTMRNGNTPMPVQLNQLSSPEAIGTTAGSVVAEAARATESIIAASGKGDSAAGTDPAMDTQDGYRAGGEDKPRDEGAERDDGADAPTAPGEGLEAFSQA